MIYAQKGHIHNSQAWYIRITNLKFECRYTPLGRGFHPYNPE